MTASGVRTWGEQHDRLWAALAAASRAVEVVVVGRDLARLREAGRVVDRWRRSSPEGDPAAELETLRAGVSRLDPGVLEACGGLDGAVKRCAALEAAVAAKAVGQPSPAITAGRVWRSERVPQ